MKKIGWWLIIPVIAFVLLLILGFSLSLFLNKKWSSFKVPTTVSSNNLVPAISNENWLVYETSDHRFSFNYPDSWLKISPANILGGLSQSFKNQPLNFQDELMFLALDKNIGQPVVLMLLKKELAATEDKNEIWKNKGLQESSIKLLSKRDTKNGYLINAQYEIPQNQSFETLEYYCFLDEKEVYELTLMAPKELFENYKNFFDQIINSVKCE